jgi:hypothetical protein
MHHLKAIWLVYNAVGRSCSQGSNEEHRRSQGGDSTHTTINRVSIFLPEKKSFFFLFFCILVNPSCVLRLGAIYKYKKHCLFFWEQMMEDHGAFGNAQRAGWCKSFGNYTYTYSLILERKENKQLRRHNLLITGKCWIQRQDTNLYLYTHGV